MKPLASYALFCCLLSFVASTIQQQQYQQSNRRNVQPQPSAQQSNALALAFAQSINSARRANPLNYGNQPYSPSYGSDSYRKNQGFVGRSRNENRRGYLGSTPGSDSYGPNELGYTGQRESYRPSTNNNDQWSQPTQKRRGYFGSSGRSQPPNQPTWTGNNQQWQQGYGNRGGYEEDQNRYEQPGRNGRSRRAGGGNSAFGIGFAQSSNGGSAFGAGLGMVGRGNLDVGSSLNSILSQSGQRSKPKEF